MARQHYSFVVQIPRLRSGRLINPSGKSSAGMATPDVVRLFPCRPGSTAPDTTSTYRYEAVFVEHYLPLVT